MKKYWGILFVFIVAALVGFLIWGNLLRTDWTNISIIDNSPKTSASKTPKPYNISYYKEPFLWGVTMQPAGLGRYIAEIWAMQVQVAKNLGVPYVRLSWDYTNPAKFDYHDEVIKALEAQGIKIYLGFNPSIPLKNVKASYNDGLAWGYRIANYYKGKIKYYQLGNEQSIGALKGSEYSGENISDYDEINYQLAKEWLRGASDGIKRGDPSAYRVITGLWLGTGFFERLERDKIDYDIIGWDWFSDMGDISSKKMADGTFLIDKLKSFNKPIFLAEINVRPEGENGQNGPNEKNQADFLSKNADWAVSANLRGFIVYQLFDNPNNPLGYTDFYGIVETEKSPSGSVVPGEARPAFYTYKDIINKYLANQ